MSKKVFVLYFSSNVLFEWGNNTRSLLCKDMSPYSFGTVFVVLPKRRIEHCTSFVVHLIYMTFQKLHLVSSVDNCFHFSDIFAFVLLSTHAVSHNYKLFVSLKAVNNIQIEMAFFKMYF
jgi:hypothetical protein